MQETIEQMRQTLAGKIKSMRKAACGDITDENAREAVAALNTAETWYAYALNNKSWAKVFYGRGQFEISEKNFWKTVKGGAE
jgi:hypothetical protein